MTSQRAKWRQGRRVLINLNKHGRDSPNSLDRALPLVVSRETGLKVFGGQPVPGSAHRCLKLTRFLNLHSFHEPFRPPADIKHYARRHDGLFIVWGPGAEEAEGRNAPGPLARGEALNHQSPDRISAPPC